MSSPNFFPGYAVPSGTYAAPPVRHSSHDSIYFSDPDGMVMEVIVPTA